MSINTTNLSINNVPQSGYDLPIYGLQDGTFTTLHVIAIVNLSTSVLGALISTLASFRINTGRGFFTRWQRRDRFVIYMAICDGLYSAVHLADHINVFVVKDHVYPKGLCVFYSFVLFPMIIAQNLLANVIAINAFTLVYFRVSLDFGERDWKLLSWIYGVPLVCSVVAAVLDKFGPTGAYCLFDGVKGASFYLAMVSIPIIVILPTNCTLYVLIWAKLYHHTRAMRASVGRVSAGQKASLLAVKSMALFILAYILQWWPATVYGFWGVVNKSIPQVVVTLVVIFANMGGLLNLGVFILINRRVMKQEQSLTRENRDTGTHATTVTDMAVISTE